MRFIGGINDYSFKSFEGKETRMGKEKYQTYVDTVDEFLKKSSSPVDNFSFNVSGFSGKEDYNYLKDSLEHINKLKQNNGNILLYDTEVIGHLSSNNFAMTEFSVKSMNINTGNIQNVGSVNMSINQTMAANLRGNIQRILQGVPLVDENDIEATRVAMIRTPYHLNVEPKNGLNFAEHSKAIDNIASGKNSVYGSENAINELKVLSDKVAEHTRINGVTASYNGLVADNPWIERTIKDHKGIGKFDFGFEVDVYKLLRDNLSSEMSDMLYEKGIDEVKGGLTQGTIAKLFGAGIDGAHIADNDVEALGEILTKTVDGKRTLIDMLQEKLEYQRNILEGSTDVLTSDNYKDAFLYAKKSISNIEKEDYLNFAISKDGEALSFKDYATSSGTFYSIDGIEAVEDNSGYVMKLSEVSDRGKTNKSVIFGNTMEELQEKISSNFSLFSDPESNLGFNNQLSRENMVLQNKSMSKDRTRRNFEAMFDINSDKGFSYTEKMYGAYEDVNEQFISKLGRPATVQEVTELVDNGHIEINGNKFTRDVLLQRFYFDENKFIYENAEDFINGYGVLEDSHETMNEIIKGINKSVTPESVGLTEGHYNLGASVFNKESTVTTSYRHMNAKKTVALNEAMNSLNQNISNIIESNPDGFISIGEKSPISFSADANFNLKSLDYASLKLDGEYASVNISDPNSINKRISGAINRRVGKTGYEGASFNSRKKIYINEAAGDLYERGLIDKETFESIVSSKNPNFGVNKMSEAINGYRTNLLNEEPIEVLASTSASKEVKEKIRKLNVGSATALNDGAMKVQRKVEDKIVHMPIDELLKSDKAFKDSNLVIGEAVSNGVNKVSTPYTFDIKAIVDNEQDFKTKNRSLSDKDVRTRNKQFKNKFREDAGDYLSTVLGYNDEYIDAVGEAIFNENYGYATRGYGVMMAEGLNKHNDIEASLYIFDPKDSKRVAKMIANGEDVSDIAAKHILPNIENTGPIRYMSVGQKKSRIVSGVSVYKKNKAPDMKDAKYIGVSVEDTVTKSIKGASYLTHKSFDKAVAEGDFKKANALIKRASTKTVYEEMGTSSPKTMRVDGKVMKDFIPSMSDVQNYHRLDDLGGFMQYLFSNDKEVRDNLIEEIRKSRGGTESKSEIRDIIYKRLGDFSKRYDYNTTSSDLGSDIQEYFIKNLYYGDNLINRIQNIEGLDDKSREVIQMYNDKGKYSQLVKPTGVYNGSYVTEVRAMDMEAGSAYSSSRRDQLNQNLNSMSVLRSDIEEYAKDRGIDDVYGKLAKNDIHVGELIRTNAAENHYFKPFRDEGMDLVSSVYINQMQMGSTELNKKLLDIDAEALAKELGVPVEHVKATIEQYLASGGTKEQHSFVRPSVKDDVFYHRELKSVKVNEDLIGKFSVGDVIDSNSVIDKISMNDEIREKLYRGKTGRIVNIDSKLGKIDIAIDDEAFGNVKFITGGIEKSVASIIDSIKVYDDNYNYKNVDVRNVSNRIMDIVAGEDISQISFFEHGKHEAGGVIYMSPVNTAAVEVSKKYDPSNPASRAAVDDFVESINKNFEQWNFKANYDDSGRLFFTMDNPKEADQVHKSVKSFIEDYKIKAENGDEFARNIYDKIISNQDRKVNTVKMRRAILNEMIGSADDTNLEKGIKHTMREDQVAGGMFKKGLWKIAEDGTLQKKIQPILDLKNDIILSSHQAKEGLKNVTNLIDSVTLMAKDSEDLADKISGSKNVRIKELTLDDLEAFIPKGEDMNPDILAHSIFSKEIYDNYDVIKLDLGNDSVKNPFRKEVTSTRKLSLDRTQHVYLPVLKTSMLDDGTIFVGESNKIVSSIVNDAIRLSNLQTGAVPKGKLEEIGKLRNSLDKNYKKLAKSLDFEINNKKGILNSSVLAGRMPTSTGLLSTGIVPASFTDETKTKVTSGSIGEKFISIENGMPVYEDTAFVSFDALYETGLTNKTIASQIVDGSAIHNGDKRAVAYYNKIRDTGLLEEYMTLTGHGVEGFKHTNMDFYMENLKSSEAYQALLEDFNPDEKLLNYKDFAKGKGDLPGIDIRAEYNQYREDFFKRKEVFRKEVSHLRGEYIHRAANTDYIKEVNKLEQIIGMGYLEDVGILASDTRHPAMHENATIVSRVVAHKNLNGKESLQTEWSAIKHRGDTDGDNKYLHYIGVAKDENGKIIIRQDSVTDAAYEVMAEQNKLNKEIVDELEGKTYFLDNKGKLFNMDDSYEHILENADLDEDMLANLKKVRGNFSSNLDEYIGHMENLDSRVLKNTNYYADPETLMISLKARHNKGAIGLISNANLALRDTFQSIAVNSGSYEMFDVLEPARVLIDTSEQKIIDIKHLRKDEISAAKSYNDAVSNMGRAKNIDEFQEAFREFYNASKVNGIYDNIDTVEDIMSGKADMALEGNRALSGVYEALKDDENRKIYRSRLRTSGSSLNSDWFDREGTVDILNALNGESVEKSVIANKKIEAIRTAMDSLNIKSGDVISKADNSGVFEVLGSDLIGKNRYLELRDLSTGAVSKIHENIDENINDYIQDNFLVLKGKTRDEIISKSNELRELGFITKSKNDLLGGGSAARDIIEGAIAEGGTNYSKDQSPLAYAIDYLSNGSREYGHRFDKANAMEKAGLLKIYNEFGRDKLAAMNVANDIIEKSGANRYDSRYMMERMYYDLIERGNVAKLAREEQAQIFKDNLKKISEDIAGYNNYSGSVNLNDNITKLHDINALKKKYSENTTSLLRDNSSLTVDDISEVTGELYGKEYVQKAKYNANAIKSNTDAFIDIYKNNNGYNKVGFNWEANLYDLGSADSLKELGKSKIGFGEFANASIEDLSIKDLQKILNDDMSFSEFGSEILDGIDIDFGENKKILDEIMAESKMRVEAYVNAVSSSGTDGALDTLRTRVTNGKNIYLSEGAKLADEAKEEIIQRGLEAKKIREAAAMEIKEGIEEAAKNNINTQNVNKVGKEADGIIKGAFDWKGIAKNKWVLGGTALGVGALALASSNASKNYLKPKQVDPEGANFDARRENESESGVSYTAPPSPPKRAILGGLAMSITGRAKGSVNKEAVYQGINQSINASTGQTVNINSVEQDNTSKIDESWIESKISRLIK